ncbi:MAG: phosphotransferase family protein [Actinomycetota bacterium]
MPDAVAPLRFEQIGGGRSNLTFKITDGRGALWVLRRPPLGNVLSTAHDMHREWRAISALSPTAVPVPDPVAFCDSDEILGAPFYVMGYVQGHVLRDRDSVLRSLPESARYQCAKSLVDVLATLHSLDADAVGLGDHGRREHYVLRQLHRWYRQWNDSRIRELQLLDQLYRRLVELVPAQRTATIVHGDYRLDNAIVDGAGTVQAVLDWELSTLGDPLADVASLLAQWRGPAAPTDVPGFPPPSEVVRLYRERSGRNLQDIEFYVAFCHWRLACILEGVYARYRAKVMGEEDVDPDTFVQEAERRAEASRTALAEFEAR